jgi:hypothetical protein
VLNEVHDATSEEDKTGVIVVFAIDGFALEGGRDVEQIARCAIGSRNLVDANLLLAFAERQKASTQWFDSSDDVAHFAIERHNKSGIDPFAAELIGESAGNIGETADFHQGRCFGSDK